MRCCSLALLDFPLPWHIVVRALNKTLLVFECSAGHRIRVFASSPGAAATCWHWPPAAVQLISHTVLGSHGFDDGGFSQCPPGHSGRISGPPGLLTISCRYLGSYRRARQAYLRVLTVAAVLRNGRGSAVCFGLPSLLSYCSDGQDLCSSPTAFRLGRHPHASCPAPRVGVGRGTAAAPGTAKAPWRYGNEPTGDGGRHEPWRVRSLCMPCARLASLFCCDLGAVLWGLFLRVWQRRGSLRCEIVRCHQFVKEFVCCSSYVDALVRGVVTCSFPDDVVCVEGGFEDGPHGSCCEVFRHCRMRMFRALQGT